MQPYPQKHTSTIKSKRLPAPMNDEVIKITPKTVSGIANG